MQIFKKLTFLQLLSALFSFTILMTSCKTATIASSTGMKKRTAKFLLQKMEENRYSYDWLAAKAKVKFVSKDENVSFNVNLRIKHDSIIWLKIQKMSVEGLRVRMSQDRIEVLNRQDNQYIVETFESIQDKMPIPFGFSEIEDLFAGNPFIKEDMEFNVSMDSLYYILEGEMKKNKKSGEPADVKLWLDGDYRLVSLFAKVDESTVEANFSNFQPINDKQSVAFDKEIILYSPESGKTRFKINFNKLDLDEAQDLKFNVPEHYEQIISGNRMQKKY